VIVLLLPSFTQAKFKCLHQIVQEWDDTSQQVKWSNNNWIMQTNRVLTTTNLQLPSWILKCNKYTRYQIPSSKIKHKWGDPQYPRNHDRFHVSPMNAHGYRCSKDFCLHTSKDMKLHHTPPRATYDYCTGTVGPYDRDETSMQKIMDALCMTPTWDHPN
jgi:hypothetical protein